MRLIAFQSQGQPAIGLRLGPEVVDLTAAGLPATLDALLRAGPEGLAAAQRAGASARSRLPLAGIAFLVWYFWRRRERETAARTLAAEGAVP